MSLADGGLTFIWQKKSCICVPIGTSAIYIIALSFYICILPVVSWHTFFFMVRAASCAAVRIHCLCCLISVWEVKVCANVFVPLVFHWCLLVSRANSYWLACHVHLFIFLCRWFFLFVRSMALWQWTSDHSYWNSCILSI